MKHLVIRCAGSKSSETSIFVQDDVDSLDKLQTSHSEDYINNPGKSKWYQLGLIQSIGVSVSAQDPFVNVNMSMAGISFPELFLKPLKREFDNSFTIFVKDYVNSGVCLTSNIIIYNNLDVIGGIEYISFFSSVETGENSISLRFSMPDNKAIETLPDWVDIRVRNNFRKEK
jgi:hypothetical protein